MRAGCLYTQKGRTTVGFADKTTIVIPNYNGMKFLPKCLASVKDSCQSIILVDNGSEDGSAEYVRTEHPDVLLIPLDKNYGFSYAVNQGICACDTEFVILLNTDVEADPDFAPKLQEAIARDEELFSVNPVMRSMRAEGVTDNAGDLNTIFGWALARGRGRRVTRYDRPCDIFSSCAGASVYRTKLLKEIGLFDDLHFLYFEDVDVGWRALLHGYRNRFEPVTGCLHYGSASTGGGRSRTKTYYAAQNSVYILFKNLSILQMLLHLPFLAVGFLCKILFFLCRGQGGSYLGGLLNGLRLSFGEGRKNRVKFTFKTMRGRWHAEWHLITDLFRKAFD